MKYGNYIQDVLEYIDKNISEDMDLERISNYIGFSRYHFHRIFKAYTGYSVSDFVRLKKFLSALRYLKESKAKILEIAVECGFETQESFTRAFKKQFDTTPGKIRRDSCLMERKIIEISLSVETAMNGKISGGAEMKPEIVFKESFSVMGLRYFGSNQNGEIPRLWDEFNKRYDEIGSKASNDCIGLCEHVENFDPDSSKFEYICCCEVSSTDFIPEGMVVRKMPPQKYAKFIHRGSVDLLGETYDKIFGEYLPSNNLQPAPAADFECYGDDFKFGEDDSVMYIYIPIK